MRGTKSFDRDEASQKAMAGFWSRGYAAASIQDLVNAPWVSTARVLYDTFGIACPLSQALDRYMRSRGRNCFELLERAGLGKENPVAIVRRRSLKRLSSEASRLLHGMRCQN